MLTQRAARRLALPCFLFVAGLSVPCGAASISNLGAYNNDTLPTTFTLSRFDLSVSFVYND